MSPVCLTNPSLQSCFINPSLQSVSPVHLSTLSHQSILSKLLHQSSSPAGSAILSRISPIHLFSLSHQSTSSACLTNPSLQSVPLIHLSSLSHQSTSPVCLTNPSLQLVSSILLSSLSHQSISPASLTNPNLHCLTVHLSFFLVFFLKNQSILSVYVNIALPTHQCTHVIFFPCLFFWYSTLPSLCLSLYVSSESNIIAIAVISGSSAYCCTDDRGDQSCCYSSPYEEFCK